MAQMVDYQNPLLSPVSKLDIKDLIDDSPSPRPSTAQSSTFSQSSSLTSPHSQHLHTPASPASGSLSHYSIRTAPPSSFGRQSLHGSQQFPPQQPPPPPLSNTAQAVFQQNPGLNPAAASAKRPPPSGNNTSHTPSKTRGKWTPAEDAKIIVLRGRGMKWDDISREIPGRSSISCRLHYQNYLEKRADWSEEQRNKLARVYDRLKSELWNPIAVELGVPWRACEAMHWALGEADMCRRAHVLPFPMATNRTEPASAGAPTPSAGRVAQRDRMRGSTRVFEGCDITTITSPTFQSVNGNGTSQTHLPYAGIPSPMSLPGISNGQRFPGYDEEGPENEDDEAEEDEDLDVDDEETDETLLQQDGPPVRRRRLTSGTTRLPGLAELDRNIAADRAASEGGRFNEAGRFVKREDSSSRRVKMEYERRSSGCSGGSGGSRRSR